MRPPTTALGRVSVATGLATAVTAFLIFVPLHRNWFDLHVYYGTVDYWTDGGRIYDYLKPGTHYGFTYPPFAALVMLPMAVVGWYSAIAISQLLNVAAAAVILYICADATIRRERWTRWFAYAVLGCLFAWLEPVRDTASFGQVNLLLLALVLSDAWLLTSATARERRLDRLAGLGIGLAAAIKLTPAIFIVYLLVTGRRKAAAVATSVAGAATVIAAWADQEASRTYWTEAMWNTDRVGSLAYVSNQSWQGLLARLTEPAAEPSRAVWAIGVLILLCLWAWRARRAVAAGDELAGFALTGIAACLVSPVTWVHHLVWLVPALAVLADSGFRAAPGGERRKQLLFWAGASYALLCSSIVWLWRWNDGGAPGFLGSNAYVWISFCLLLLLPFREAPAAALDGDGPHDHTGASATISACAEATGATGSPSKSRPVSQQSAPPVSSTPRDSKPARSGSAG
ncbi:glycosyltransferase 87 family protein [Streptomyces formicae]|uniref:glycosyltransferase 87 family protein n=1 Tax=Streptomyces formicae TaxID=1616117 RepID=UPI001F583358|nr:glycosyltransferase 87 family protein [Streptomyces formicae]